MLCETNGLHQNSLPGRQEEHITISFCTPASLRNRYLPSRKKDVNLKGQTQKQTVDSAMTAFVSPLPSIPPASSPPPPPQHGFLFPDDELMGQMEPIILPESRFAGVLNPPPPPPPPAQQQLANGIAAAVPVPQALNQPDQPPQA